MTASIVEVIQHYQRSIDNSQDNEDRLLYCIKKLYKLPIKVEHLQETGVGKTVNSLRKFNGEIGVAAKSLVTKWKAMVAAEEEPMDTTTPHDYDNETHDSNHNHDDHDDEQSPHNSGDGGGGDGVMDDEDHENHNQNIAQEQHKHSGHSEKEKHKERHKDRSHKESSSKHASSSTKDSDDKYKSSSSSSSRDKEAHQHKSSSSSKEREKEKTEHKSRDKHKDKDRDQSEKRNDEKHKSEKESTSHKSSSSKTRSEDKPSSSSKDKPDKERSDKHKSSSKDRERSKEDKSSSKDKHERKSASSSSSHKSSAKDTSEPTERKRRNTSDTESNDFKSPQPKVAKVIKSSSSSTKAAELSPPQENDTDDSFDSSTGANFGDILGMLNAPSKKGKKSLKPSTSSSVKDSSKPSTSNNITSKANGIQTSPSVYSPQTPTKTSTAKPDLLAPTAKLAPLDPSIALELPTISTNYKPMPLNQTVMDCVFNTSSSSTSRPVRTLTDAEALHHGISSKTMRTKIYSGVRTGQIFQVPSLFDMCIRILQKNIDALEYTGGVPFEVLRPVLDRATPQQLYIFEEYNPYLMEDSDVLWQTHVSRNYRTQKRLENESWREMFMRCQEEEERRLSILKNSIKQSQKIAAAPVRKTQLAFVDSMVKPPRNVMRKQEQYGTKAKLVATPAARVASLQSVTPNAAKTGDQRLRVAPIVRDHAQVASSAVRPKKAPLMQKTLAFIRGRLKR